MDPKTKKAAKAVGKAAEPFELPALKVEFVQAEQLTKIKEKHRKALPISDIAVSMSKKMLEDLNSGAVIPLTSAQMPQKESIKTKLRRDLERIAKQAGLNYSIWCIEDGQSLIFYYQQKGLRPAKKTTTPLPPTPQGEGGGE